MAVTQVDQKFSNYIRVAGVGWNGQKYGRLATYVFLYNKIIGMPKSYGFKSNSVLHNDVNNYIRDHYDELCKTWHLGKIDYLDLDGDGKSKFLSELNEYSAEAMRIGEGAFKRTGEDGNKIPDYNQMRDFIQNIQIQRRSYYMNIYGSVKEETGESYSSDKDAEGALIHEYKKKLNQVRDQQREMRITARHGALYGGGALASLGAGVALSIAFFPFGLVGGVAGLMGARRLGNGFIRSIGRWWAQHKKMRDLKHKKGAKGEDRGLKEIENQIAVNKAIKKAFGDFEKMVKVEKDQNGTIKKYHYPSKEEYMRYIKSHYPELAKFAKVPGDPYRVQLDRLYWRSQEYFEGQKGCYQAINQYLGDYTTVITKNQESGLERNEYWKDLIGPSGALKGIENGKSDNMDRVKRARGLMRNMDLENLEENSVKGLMHMYEHLELDKDAIVKNGQDPHLYEDYEDTIADMLPVMFQNQIFNLPFNANTTRSVRDSLNNEKVKKLMERIEGGNPEPFLKGLVRMIEMEGSSARLHPDESDVTIARTNLNASLASQFDVNNENITKTAEEILMRDRRKSKLRELEVRRDTLTESVKSDPALKAELDEVENKIKNIDSLSASELLSEEEVSAISEIENILTEVENDQFKLEMVLNKPEYVEVLNKLGSAKEYVKAMIDRKSQTTQHSETYYQNIVGELLGQKDSRYDGLVSEICKIKFQGDSIVYNGKVYDGSEDKGYTSLIKDLRIYCPKDETKLNNEKIINELLSEQLKQNNREEILKIKSEAFRDLQNGKFSCNNGDFEKLLTYINDLDFEKLKTVMPDFVTKELQYVQPDSVKKYLQLKLEQKTEVLFKTRLEQETYYRSADGLAHAIEDMKLLNSFSGFMRMDQKAYLVKKFNSHVAKQIEIDLDKFAQIAFDPSQNGKIEPTLYSWLRRPVAQGGFNGVLEQSQIDKINRIRDLVKKVQGGAFIVGTNDFKMDKDANEPGTKLFEAVYVALSDNHVTELATKVEALKRISSQIKNKNGNTTLQSFSMSSDTSKLMDDNLLRELRTSAMENLKNELGENEDKEINKGPEACARKMAYLVMFQRQMIAEFKTKIKAISSAHYDGLSDYFRNTSEGSGKGGKEYYDKIKEFYGDIFTDINAKFKELQKEFDNYETNTLYTKFVEDVKKYNGTLLSRDAILASVTPATIADYISKGSSTDKDNSTAMISSEAEGPSR